MIFLDIEFIIDERKREAEERLLFLIDRFKELFPERAPYVSEFKFDQKTPNKLRITMMGMAEYDFHYISETRWSLERKI